MDTIMLDPWWSALAVLVTQIIFLYARTLNVMYTADRRKIPSIISGNVIGIAWLVSVAIGVNALMTMQWQPILGHLIGGTIGTIMAFRRKV